MSADIPPGIGDEAELELQFKRTEALLAELLDRLHRECHEGHPANTITALESAVVYTLHAFKVPTPQFAARVSELRFRMYADPIEPERAACIHCKQDVCAIGDVEAIRLHSTTCSASPVVTENVRLEDLVRRQSLRIKELELQLQQARC